MLESKLKPENRRYAYISQTVDTIDFDITLLKCMVDIDDAQDMTSQLRSVKVPYLTSTAVFSFL